MLSIVSMLMVKLTLLFRYADWSTYHFQRLSIFALHCDWLLDSGPTNSRPTVISVRSVGQSTSSFALQIPT